MTTSAHRLCQDPNFRRENHPRLPLTSQLLRQQQALAFPQNTQQCSEAVVPQNSSTASASTSTRSEKAEAMHPSHPR